MPAKQGNSVRVRGRALRLLRKSRFSSAEAFAAACGSVSTPTIYRAERSGPVQMAYLAAMARSLGVEPGHLIEREAEDSLRDLTGAWVGLYVGTDRFGQPDVIEETADLVQDGTQVDGHIRIEAFEREAHALFTECSMIGNA